MSVGLPKAKWIKTDILIKLSGEGQDRTIQTYGTTYLHTMFLYCCQKKETHTDTLTKHGCLKPEVWKLWILLSAWMNRGLSIWFHSYCASLSATRSFFSTLNLFGSPISLLQIFFFSDTFSTSSASFLQVQIPSSFKFLFPFNFPH